MSLATFWAGIQGGAAPFSVQFIGTYIVSDIALNPLDARAIVEIQADGDVFARRLQGSDFLLGTWVTGTGFDANDFDFQWQQLGNNPNWGPGDPSPNIWVNGGGAISWGAEETGLGTYIASGTLLVRPAGGGATIDSAGVSLNAESTL
jgi:hypothetical protein